MTLEDARSSSPDGCAHAGAATPAPSSAGDHSTAAGRPTTLPALLLDASGAAASAGVAGVGPGLDLSSSSSSSKNGSKDVSSSAELLLHSGFLEKRTSSTHAAARFHGGTEVRFPVLAHRRVCPPFQSTRWGDTRHKPPCFVREFLKRAGCALALH
jgi:hypothetical protein